MKIQKNIYFFFWGGSGRGGGGGGVVGGQGECERRIEVFVKIPKKMGGGVRARVWGGRVGRSGWGGGGGRVDVKEK